MSAFKAYDIRGIWGEDIDEDLCYKVGYFLPSLLNAKEVVVGRDIRLSSDAAYKALTEGITDSGADVLSLGLSTTPMVYFATVFLGSDASAQITASHNPKEYNGIKISRTGAVPVGSDSGLKELEKLVDEGKITKAVKKGVVKDCSYVRDEYVKFLKGYSDGIENLNISVDCSFGMSNLVIKDVLGTEVSYIYDHYDGNFPAHEPNPLEEKNCKDIERAVRENKSDIGVIFDGDADRVMFIDEKGSFIQPDYITAVIGLYYKERGRVGNALQDVRTSRSTTEYLEALGYNVTTWKVGHAFAKTKIREINAVFGGELAGHYYFRDFFWCDSGVFACLAVLKTVAELKTQGRTLSSLINEIVRYSNSGEINFRLDNKDAAISALCERFITNDHPVRVMDFDGYRIEFDTWWFSVRKSNTEPYLRIVAESDSDESLKERLSDIESIIRRFS